MRKLSFCYINEVSTDEYIKEYNMLNSADKAKIDKIKSTAGKKRSIAGRMLARKGISEIANVDLHKIKFNLDKNGKPYSPDINVFFSISHSKNCVVCAVNDMPIGIDTEYIRPISKKLILRVCTSNEAGYVLGNYADQSAIVYDDIVLERFFKVWTLKEAYFKYIGTGIQTLKNIDVMHLAEYTETIYCRGYAVSIVAGGHNEKHIQ